ncbi:MAG: hypothetical protein ACYC3A_09220 [Halothiobacillus sp.]
MKSISTIRSALPHALACALMCGGLIGSAAADEPSPIAPTTPALSCDNARFVKSITLARVWIPAPPQDVLDLGAALSEHIAAVLQKTGHFNVTLTDPTRTSGLEPAIDAFSRDQTPYFVRISGHNFGITGQASPWAFLGPSTNPRGGTLNISLANGQTPRTVAKTALSAQPVDAGTFAPPIDARDPAFAQSLYGQSLHTLTTQAAQWIDQSLGCEPLFGQVIALNGAEITINRGVEDGLRASDRVQVLQRSDPLIQLGQTHLPNQYLLQNLGMADIAYLGNHTTRLHLTRQQAIQIGDVIQVGQ